MAHNVIQLLHYLNSQRYGVGCSCFVAFGGFSIPDLARGLTLMRLRVRLRIFLLFVSHFPSNIHLLKRA